MEAFEHQPETWPADDWFDQHAMPGQLNYLRACRDSTPDCNGRMFRQLCTAILEAYGLPDEINRGSAEVLMDFFRSARAKCKRLAFRQLEGVR